MYDIAFAVTSEVLSLNTIKEILPKELRSIPPKKRGEFFYWFIHLDSHGLVDDFFEDLGKEDGFFKSLESFFYPQENINSYFGAIVLNRDTKEFENYGNTHSFHLHSVAYIDSPYLGEE